jgi:serine/threonine protein kinase
MGVVYRAYDSSLGRHVALKTLPNSSAHEVKPLRREARAMAAVVHPHLASIYSLETWAGRPILVCEYLAKGTLADRLKAGPMPSDEALGIGCALGDALARLHRSGILHRDIKPSNIGFSNTDEPKLLDFGLARILFADESLSASSLGNIAGTLRYVSPDVLNGGVPTTDSDVWSLSLSLYEAVAGVHPYEGRDMLATHTLARSGKIPDIRDYRPDTPPAVADMFRRALSPDPRERPATATALISLLSSVGTGHLNVA